MLIKNITIEKIMNDCYAHRNNITPDNRMRNYFGPLELFTFLHDAHCGKCGELNCMDFAIKVAKGAAPLCRCKEISTNEFARKWDDFLRIFNPPAYNISEDDSE
ncbi:MAG: hypothetical protein GWP07_04170 [Xanthomonadaceae bacterium]|nr:hypothetical protein [Xanthomonadaceae bacterium]